MPLLQLAELDVLSHFSSLQIELHKDQDLQFEVAPQVELHQDVELQFDVAPPIDLQFDVAPHKGLQFDVAPQEDLHQDVELHQVVVGLPSPHPLVLFHVSSAQLWLGHWGPSVGALGAPALVSSLLLLCLAQCQGIHLRVEAQLTGAAEMSP